MMSHIVITMDSAILPGELLQERIGTHVTPDAKFDHMNGRSPRVPLLNLPEFPGTQNRFLRIRQQEDDIGIKSQEASITSMK